ncbi:MAG: hypothetical protein Q9182_004659 [Xanthomendoza sp. 2 TL-2023]
MAEVLFDDVDDDDLWIEDPYAEADDLAEHTMPSPVLINYDPTLDVDDGWTDWEEYSDAAADDIYDDDMPNRKRRKLDNTGTIPNTSARQRQEAAFKSVRGVSVLSLGKPAASDEQARVETRSIVQWKVIGKSPKPPVLRIGQEEKVSILKDWRERFKPPPSKHQDSKRFPTNGAQRAFAVIIENGARSATARRDSEIYEDVEESHPDPTTAPSHRGEGAKISRTNVSNSGNATLKKQPPSTRNQIISSSSISVSEPVIVQNLTNHQSEHTFSGPTRSSVIERKARAALKQAEPQAKKTNAKKMDDTAAKKENLRPSQAAKRKMSDGSKQPPELEPEHELKKVKGNPCSDAATKKENTRPSGVKKRKMIDAPEDRDRQPLKKVKTEGSREATTTKENIRPKAAAVGRRNTRRT